MRFIIATLAGAFTAVIAILVHQSIPPFGVIVALTFSCSAIWLVGRRFAARIYKWCAAAGWIAVILRGSTFGEGQELLVQGDAVGSTLLLLGTLLVLFTVAARV